MNYFQAIVYGEAQKVHRCTFFYVISFPLLWVPTSSRNSDKKLISGPEVIVRTSSPSSVLEILFRFIEVMFAENENKILSHTCNIYLVRMQSIKNLSYPSKEKSKYSKIYAYVSHNPRPPYQFINIVQFYSWNNRDCIL